MAANSSCVELNFLILDEIMEGVKIITFNLSHLASGKESEKTNRILWRKKEAKDILCYSLLVFLLPYECIFA